MHTVPELVKALNDTSVDHITLAAPSFNFTDAEMPEESAIISARNLTMEGMDLPDGKQVYIDVSAKEQPLHGSLCWLHLWRTAAGSATGQSLEIPS